jgi:hypothetical protein
MTYQSSPYITALSLCVMQDFFAAEGEIPTAINRVAPSPDVGAEGKVSCVLCYSRYWSPL